jgi:hypothetical protein
VVVNLKLTTITASNAVYPLAPTLGALSNGAAGIANASATVTGTNTRKILKPVDYALALSGTWLGGPWP